MKSLFLVGVVWLVDAVANAPHNPPLMDDQVLATALLGLEKMTNNTKWPKGEDRELDFERTRGGALPRINSLPRTLGASEFDSNGRAVGFHLRRQHVQWIEWISHFQRPLQYLSEAVKRRGGQARAVHFVAPPRHQCVRRKKTDLNQLKGHYVTCGGQATRLKKSTAASGILSVRHLCFV